MIYLYHIDFVVFPDTQVLGGIVGCVFGFGGKT